MFHLEKMTETVQLSERPPDPVLVVGSVAYDNIVTPFETGERLLGGSASYAALAASCFAPARLAGVVGHDFDPQFIEKFRRRGIDLEGLQRDESGPTFFWKGRYHENFNRRDTLEIKLNVFEKFRPDLPESYRATPYVLLGNIHPGLQRHVLDRLTCPEPFTAADTIDLWIKTELPAFEEIVRRVSLLVINDSEAQLMTGQHNLIRAGRQLLKNGPEAIIIKKGEHGAVLFHPEGMFALPAYPVTELRDPTGAGDAFAGALLGALAALGETGFTALKQAMLYAAATASLTVEAFSCGRLESAGPAEIRRRRDELLKITSL